MIKMDVKTVTLEKEYEEAYKEIMKEASIPSGFLKNKKRIVIPNRNIYLSPDNMEKLLNYNLTDAGNAELFRDLLDDEFCYVPERGHWFRYDGVRWSDADERATLMMLNVVRSRMDAANLNITFQKNNDDFRLKVIKWALSSESSFKLRAALTIAEAMLTKKYEEFDKEHFLFCCQNGVIDLKAGKFRESKPEDFLHKCTHINFDLGAECPRWIQFLDEIFRENESIIHFIQKAVGYTLTGKTTEQIMFILYGGGENGKSTFLDIVGELLGDFGISTQMDTFKERYNDNSIPNDIAALCGKRFVKATEIREGSRLNEERVKSLTGSDRISARFLHKEFFDFDPTHKIWLAVNHKPIIKGTDNAIWRRMRLIPFEASFPQGQRDENLKDKLLAELPGILNWAVLGCLLWQEEGLEPPQKIKKATQAYREESDIIGRFLEERTSNDPQEKIKASDLYRAYKQWCEAVGERSINQKNFGSRMSEKAHNRDKSTGGYIYYFGLKLIGPS